MSSSSRSASPYLANGSDTSRSTPDKDETASETDERGEEFVGKVAASPASTITPPKACEQDDAILVASLSKSPLQQLMERTGCGIVQVNGQRHYGPPSKWTGPPPPRGSEVFVGKIPRDCFEDELVPIFERAGYIYEMRLMMEYTGQNRGYAFVVYSKPSEAKECIKTLNNYEIRKGRYLGVCISVDNCRLFVGGIPKRAQKDEVIAEISKVTEGVVDVIMYPSASDKTKNRGFAFIEYECHRAAAMARRKLMSGGIQLWGHQIAVDWAEPEIEPDEEIMSQVKVLYVRNLMLTTSEQLIQEAFSYHAPVERVKKIRDYAFVHFETRNGAMKALRALNGSMLDGSLVEVSLAKPVDRDTYQKSPRFCRVVSPYQSWGYIPLEYAHYAAAAAMMWGASSYLPAATVRPAMTSAGSRAFSCRTPSRGQFTYPPYPSATAPATAMTPPPTRYYSPPATTGYYRPVVYPTATQYGGSPNKQRGKGRGRFDEPSQVILPDSTTLTPPNTLSMKKSSVQFLDDMCTKNGWGAPSYSLHSTSSAGGLSHSDLQLFLYHIRIPAMGVTFQPTKLSPSVDEAQRIAAEYCLMQLGYPMDCYSSHATPTSSPVRLGHQATATPNTFSAVPNCFITPTGAMTNTNTPTTSKLFPWQHEVATSPHQTTAGLYAAYELPPGHQPSSGCMPGHGELYPTTF